MSIRVLITGATGFVGSHILEVLMKAPSITLTAACRDRKKLLKHFTGTVKTGDLRDTGYVDELVQNVDVICHAAAWTSLWNHKNMITPNPISVFLFLPPTPLPG